MILTPIKLGRSMKRQTIPPIIYPNNTHIYIALLVDGGLLSPDTPPPLFQRCSNAYTPPQIYVTIRLVTIGCHR